MARLIISVDAVGVRAIAGPVTGAAVLYDAAALEPIFAVKNKRGELVRYSLLDPKAIPSALIPGIVAHIRKTALSCAYVHRPARMVTTSKEAAWTVMGQAAARAAERAVHQNLAACQVGPSELEIYIPTGGHCPYALVGRVGQRPVMRDWRRGAAFILAKAAHFDALNEMHARFPEYDFINNRGNTSQVHLKALRRYGRTPEHRRSA